MGALTFLVYVNDLPGVIISTARLFADDCLLYRNIRTERDSELLQKDFHNLEQWENTRLM